MRDGITPCEVEMTLLQGKRVQKLLGTNQYSRYLNEVRSILLKKNHQPSRGITG
jgi:hypothetical protein